MKRRILTILIVLTSLTLLCIAALVYWINPLAKTSIEHIGTAVLGTELTVEQVWVKPLRGRLSAKGIRIKNPEGFTAPDLLKIENASIRIQLRSLRTSTLIVRSITLEHPELTLQRHQGTDNLRALLNRTNNTPKQEETPATRSKNIVIDELLIRETRLRIADETNHPLVELGAENIQFQRPVNQLTAHNLTVSNPPDYSAPHLFFIKSIQAGINCPHISSFHLTDLRIGSPKLTVEPRDSTNNLLDLRKTIVPFLKPASSPEPSIHEGPAPAPSNLSLIPDRIIIENGQLQSFNPRLPEASARRNEISFHRFTLLPPEGVARFRQLTIANPRRFSNEHIVQLDELQIAIDPASIKQKPLRVLEFNLIGPRFVFEQRLRTDNVAVLQHNMLSLAGQMDTSNHEEQNSQDKDDPNEPTMIVVDHLLVKEGKVLAKISKLPTTTVSLPTIERFGIGADGEGAGYTVLTQEISGIIYKTILQSVTGLGGLAAEALKKLRQPDS